MRITKWVCDRCGCEYSKAQAKEENYPFYLQRNTFDDDTEDVDLCPQCADKLASWIARGKVDGCLHQYMEKGGIES